MMSGVPLETCWAFNKLWNNKFYYKAAFCWYFYWVIYDARIHEYQNDSTFICDSFGNSVGGLAYLQRRMSWRFVNSYMERSSNEAYYAGVSLERLRKTIRTYRVTGLRSWIWTRDLQNGCKKVNNSTANFARWLTKIFLKRRSDSVRCEFTMGMSSRSCSVGLDSQFYGAWSFIHVFRDSGRPVLTCVVTAWRVAPGWLLHKWTHWCRADEGNGLQIRKVAWNVFNPLNAELNPICHFLALLRVHHYLHVSRIRVKSLNLRLLMPYIYGAPILDVSRSHTTHHSR